MVSRVKAFLASPTFEDEKKTRAAYILNVVLLTMLTAVVGVGGIYVVVQTISGVSSEIVFFLFRWLAGGLILLYILMRRGFVQLAGIGLTLLFLWFSNYLLPEAGTQTTTTPLTTPFIITFILPIVMAGLILGARGGIVTTLISGAILAVAAFRFDPEFTLNSLLLSLWPLYMGVYLSVALLMRLATNTIATALNEARQSNQELQIANEQMEQRVTERTRDLALAADVARGLAQVRDVETLLTHAVESVRSRFELYYAQIYLIDAAGQNLVLRAGTGDVGQELRARNHQLPLNAGSINGAAVVNHRAIIVADTETSPIFRRNPLLPDTRSEMAVPLITGEMVVGVLDLQSTQPNALSSENLGAFEILAGQLAITIENARLIRDTNRAHAELESSIQSNVRQDWDRYLDAIHRGEQIGYVYVDGELEVVQAATEGGKGKAKATSANALRMPVTIAGEAVGVVELANETATNWLPEDVELVEAVARQVSQQIENLRLLEESEQYRQEAEEAAHRLIREGWADIQEAHQGVGFYYDHTAVQPLSTLMSNQDAILRAPLAVQGETVGQIELLGVASDDEQSARFLTAVAERLSAQLENLRLSEQTERALAQSQAQREELSVLNELSRTLTTVSDLDSAFTLIYEYAARLVDASSFYIVLYEEAKEEISFAFEVFDGKVERPFFRRQMGNGVTEYVIRNKRPLLLPDNVATRAQALGVEFIGKEARAWLGVPLLLGDTVIGVIAVQNYHTPRVYNEDSERRLTALANQAAVAIENVRLFTQIQNRARQEQILREVTARVHSAVDAQSVLRTAAQEINRTLGLEAFVYLEDHIESEMHGANGGNGRHETAPDLIGEPQ